ncbi:integrase [Rhodobacteraceae bacterium CCMM004]|nr:integrase [Rhodobacteraceae bacterium CCMM004]
MKSRELKYISGDFDRHGNRRVYFRKPGQPKVRIREKYGSAEFYIRYRDLLSGVPEKESAKPGRATKMTPASIRWLCAQYYQSAMFAELNPKTQKTRRAILERFCLHKNGGDKPFKLLGAVNIRKRRDEMRETPEAANSMVKVLRQLYRFAVLYEHCDHNPAANVELLRSKSEGYHSWTLAEIEKYEAAHPVGTTARLALALALYTGQRRSDLVLMGRQHVQDGWLCFTQQKGKDRHPVRLELPIIPALQAILDASPKGDLTFLANANGQPFTNNGFGNRVRKWCDTAGLPHCSIHGLRKAAAARLAELGCTEFEIMAITGHQTSKEVTRYTRSASQKVRAAAALQKITGQT